MSWVHFFLFRTTKFCEINFLSENCTAKNSVKFQWDENFRRWKQKYCAAVAFQKENLRLAAKRLVAVNYVFVGTFWIWNIWVLDSWILGSNTFVPNMNKLKSINFSGVEIDEPKRQKLIVLWTKRTERYKNIEMNQKTDQK